VEADWSVEIGAGLPTIDLPWEGWIDLRGCVSVEDVSQALAEAREYPELGEVLLKTRDLTDAVTAKCDVFSVEMDEARRAMLEMPGDEAQEGLGSYLDFALSPAGGFADFASCEGLVRRITSRLAALPLAAASAEIVLRAGSFFEESSYGLTVYAFGYGRDRAAARTAWAEILAISTYITMGEIAHGPSIMTERSVLRIDQPGE
jgi:hypothetical protein